jgi:chromate reductase
MIAAGLPFHPPRRVLVYLNMFPINQPEVLISHAMDRFDQEGNLTDMPTRERITGLLQNLVYWARHVGPR